jgi:hypothetical protein
MRFPHTQVMKRTYALFDRLKIPLLDYHIFQCKNWLAFNNHRYRREQIQPNNCPESAARVNWTDDPFKVGVNSGGAVPEEYARQNPSVVLGDIIKPFLDMLVKNRREGLKHLFKFDHLSTRGYLTQQQLTQSTIDYIETMASGTGWFDRAFS